MGLRTVKILLCLGTGLVQYLFQVLPNIWLLWDHLSIASYPKEAHYEANSLEACVSITAASALAFMSAGWYTAKDRSAPLLAMLSLIASMIAEIVFEYHGEFMSVTYGMLFLMLAIEIAYGSPRPKDKRVLRSWYKHSMVKKEFCLAAIAVLISLSYRAQPTCYAQLGNEGFSIDIDPAAVGKFSLGDTHELVVSTDQVVVKEGSGKVLFASQAGHPFVVGALGGVLDARNEQEMSLFDINDAPEETSKRQTVASVGAKGNGVVVVEGEIVFDSGKQTTYQMTFRQASAKAIKFSIERTGGEVLSRTYLVQASEENEHVFGMGIQFTYFNLKGGCVPVFTQEQGIGRGLQPLSFILNLAAKHAPGSWPITYAPVPYFLSSKLRSFYLENTEFSVFDFSSDERTVVELNGTKMTGGICSGNTHLEVINCYAEMHAGFMRPLPAWTGNGAILGLQGGTEVVKAKLKALKDVDAPVAGLWLQDWSGKRETILGRRLQWNWQLDREFYPGWDEFLRELSKEQIYILTYINAYLANTGTNTGVFDLANEADCLLKAPDGSALIQSSGSDEFTFGTVDLMSDRCQEWYIAEVIQKQMLGVDSKSFDSVQGAMGWMADFAEGISMDVVSETGLGHEFHNEFPVKWAETCRKAIAMNKFTEENVVFFSRSGGIASPRYSTLMWMGDQLTTWDEYDGMKSALGGILSSGLSGFSLTHSDVGGYTMVKVLYKRSEQLMKRWTEMNAFSDAVLRTHEGINPDESEQAYDDCCAQHFATFSRLHRELYKVIKKKLIQEASETGAPLARHLLLHYPQDPFVYKPESRFQFLLGPNILVCPVFEEGVESVKCYIPEEKAGWTHVFTGKVYGKTGGEVIDCDAPIGRPCVLYLPAASDVAQVIRKTLTP